MINYAPGSGGDFLANVISYSDSYTLPILQNDDMLIIEQVDGHFRVKGSIMYGFDFNQNPTLWGKIKNMSAEEIVDAYRFNYIEGISNKGPNKFKNSLLFGFEHWKTHDKEKIKRIVELTNWYFIDITPELPQSKKVLTEYNKAIGFLTKDAIQKFYKVKYEFIEHFPFMDYVIIKDYESIKYWIEENYGSHLNFDYIDRKMKYWRKIRVEPYL